MRIVQFCLAIFISLCHCQHSHSKPDETYRIEETKRHTPKHSQISGNSKKNTDNGGNIPKNREQRGHNMMDKRKIISTMVKRDNNKRNQQQHVKDNYEDEPSSIKRNGITYIQETGDPDFYDFPDPFYQYENVTIGELQKLIGMSQILKPANKSTPRCFKGKCGGYPFNMYNKYYPKLFYTLREIQKLEKMNRRRRNNSGQQPSVTHLGYETVLTGEETTKAPNATTLPSSGTSMHPTTSKPGRPGGNHGPSEHGRPGGNAGTSGPSGTPDNDGDNCCPTILSHLDTKFLDNTEGVKREIVQFIGGTPAYQQYIPVGDCVSNSQPGCRLCKMQQRLHFLLVMDPDSTQFPPVKFDKFFIDSYCSCQAK